jgi:hypothetical protein
MVSLNWSFGVMWPISEACSLLGLAGILIDRRHNISTAQ